MFRNLAALFIAPAAPIRRVNVGSMRPDTTECLNVSKDPVLVQVTETESKACNEIPVGCTEIVHVELPVSADDTEDLLLQSSEGMWKIEKIIDEGTTSDDVRFRSFSGTSKNPYGYQPGDDATAGAFSAADDRQQPITQFDEAAYDAGTAPMPSAMPEMRSDKTQKWVVENIDAAVDQTAFFRLVLRKLQNG